MPTDSPTAEAINSSPILEVPLSNDVLTGLFATMLKARLAAKRLRTSAATSEAILAGALANLGDSDVIVAASAHPVLEVLRGAEIFTVARKQEAAVVASEQRIVVSGNNACAGIAAGLALSSRRTNSDSVIVLFISGKQTRNSSFDDACDYAAHNQLPLVVIADCTQSRTPSRNHDGTALSHWPFPTIAVDGRDVIAVYRVTKEAITAARRGHGPTLVDCVNFLAPGGRRRDERDPLAAFRGYLQRHNAWSDTWCQSLENDLRREFSSSRNVPAAKM